MRTQAAVSILVGKLAQDINEKQELMSFIQDLNTQVNELQKQNNELQRQIDALQKSNKKEK